MIDDYPKRKEELTSLNIFLTKALKEGAVAVVTHRNGDMDTVCSAIALARFLGPRSRAMGLHLNKEAGHIVNKEALIFHQVDAKMVTWPRNLAGVVVVDAASPEQVGFELPNRIPKAILDHHPHNKWELEKHDLYLDWRVSATTQIVKAFIEYVDNDALDTMNRKLLLLGLITDTGRFNHADKNSLRDAADLLEDSSLDYTTIIEELQSIELTKSQKGALAKGLGRTRIETAGAWHLLTSRVGTNESNLANALIVGGADVALVSRSRDGWCRLTSRASKGAIRRGVDVGKIMHELVERIGGEGGGHPGAAGWSGECEIIEAESAFINLLAQIPEKN